MPLARYACCGKEKRTFSLRKSLQLPPGRRWSFGQEGKRNKWREARRAPFMPDCDLDQSSTFCSQHPMTEGYQGRSPWLVSTPRVCPVIKSPASDSPIEPERRALPSHSLAGKSI